MIETRSPVRPGYGAMAKLLHWLIFILVAAQFAVAWTMPAIHRGTKPEGLINVHLSLGSTILAVVVIRLLWRAFHQVPSLADAIPVWQQTLARIVHGLLYLLLLIVPGLGWANASARGFAVYLFGFVPLPPLLTTGSVGLALGDVHTLAAYGILGLVGLHILAALYHHLWLRDPVLLRMLPRSSST